ncbi:hypothetical protein [Enterococcus faecalis]|uniref:hypothetical protein n=1 Tax=Enterococcus faecalis TaxID=1351 RepID=UPI001C8BB857|nr:hypothetical protein [Enterococcus faecalis]MBX9006073.1 hypothetical protein [Enterococcus faecalis]
MESKKIVVNAKEFLKTLKRTVIATKDARTTVLRGVHVIVGQDFLIIEGTDAASLEKNKIQAEVDQKFVGREIWIEYMFAKELSKYVSKHGEKIVLMPQFNDALANDAIGTLTIVDGYGDVFVDKHPLDPSTKYPQLGRIIPQEGAVKFTTTKKNLLPTLKNAYKLVKKEQWNTVKMVIKQGNVTLEADGQEFLVNATNVSDKELSIYFNVSKLIKLISSNPMNESLEFSFQGKLRPILIKRKEENLSILTPIRK